MAIRATIVPRMETIIPRVDKTDETVDETVDEIHILSTSCYHLVVLLTSMFGSLIVVPF